MIRILFILPLMYSCSTIATEIHKPSGEDVFDTLLEIGDIKLSDEPLCNVISTTRDEKNINLGNHLSTVLSTSYSNDTFTQISSSCTESKDQVSDGSLLDIWDCKVELLEQRGEGDFVSSSMIAFSLTFEKHDFIYGSLRCF